MLISGVLILENGKICFHNNVKKIAAADQIYFVHNRKKGFLIDFNLLSQHARLWDFFAASAPVCMQPTYKTLRFK